MPLRLLHYLLAIMDYHNKQYPDEGYPIIYPLIFYTGKNAYTESTYFFDLFAEHKEVMKSILLQPFQLVDVHRLHEEDASSHVWINTLTAIYKYARSHQLIQVLKELKPNLKRIDVQGGSNYIEILLYYVLEQAKSADVGEAIQVVTEGLSPETGAKIMTLADQLRHQGIQQERHMMASRLLAKGMSLKEIHELTKLSLEEIKKLKEKQSH